jgi:hypothetical protein
MGPSATALGESMWARVLHDSTSSIHFMSKYFQRLSFFRLPRPASSEPAVIGSFVTPIPTLTKAL